MRICLPCGHVYCSGCIGKKLQACACGQDTTEVMLVDTREFQERMHWEVQCPGCGDQHAAWDLRRHLPGCRGLFKRCHRCEGHHPLWTGHRCRLKRARARNDTPPASPFSALDPAVKQEQPFLPQPPLREAGGGSTSGNPR